MAAITETCSVCASSFEMQFRYQMEERDGGFSFFCSQRCLEASQLQGAGGDRSTTCDACAKRFSPDLVSQILYLGGRRRYACSLSCRSQLVRESNGARLGDIAHEAQSAVAAAPLAEPPAPPPRDGDLPPVLEPRLALQRPASAVATTTTTPITAAQAVPTVPTLRDRSHASHTAPKRGFPRAIAVFNHKGGTGKTTTAVSVAAGLAARGKRVLIIDTDAQGNVAVSLDAPTERSLYHVLVMGLRVSDATTTVRPNLDLLPSNETLAAAELYLAGRQNRDRVLCDRLGSAAEAYDFVVIDCSPSLSLMNQNALTFADSVLVPVACDYLSLVGVRQVIKTVKNVNALLHHPVQIWGVLPTFYDARANICREAVATLRSHFGDRCLSPIRAAIKVKEAPAQGQTIFEYASGSNAADDYLAVVDRILENRARAEEGVGQAAEGPATRRESSRNVAVARAAAGA